MSDDFAHLDATAQAELVSSGEASPTELVDAAIARVEALNPELNAVIHDLSEEGRQAAAGELPDGPFKGVPFLFKDIGAALAGQPFHLGSRVLKEVDFRIPVDTYLGQRFRDAGFVTIGKTNVPELGILPTTEPAAHGPSKTPGDTSRSTGGSSGGSAAAVASGMVAVAHANDGGGSIRIPASCCGLVGLKPTRGRVPIGTDLNEVSNFLICEHVVSRTVRDTAELLDVTGAPRSVGASRAPTPHGPFAADVGIDPGSLRIGFLDADPTGQYAVDAECVAAVTDAARLLDSLGPRVDPSFPAAWSDAESLARFSSVWTTECAHMTDDGSEKVGGPVGEDDV